MYTQKKLIQLHSTVKNSTVDDKTLQTFDRITTYPYGYKNLESMKNRIVNI